MFESQFVTGLIVLLAAAIIWTFAEESRKKSAMLLILVIVAIVLWAVSCHRHDAYHNKVQEMYEYDWNE